MTAPEAPARGLLFLAGRVFLPFAAGYFLSYLFRTVNAVLGPVLGEELTLDAAAVGLMTSAFFLAFAGIQIPLGMALDRFGPRRTHAVLLVIAAAGAVLFSQGDGTPVLTLARAIIGIGMAGGLLAAMKMFALWFPGQKLPLINGLVLAAGGAGAMAASAPVHAMIALIGWRHLFLVLAAVTLLVAVLIHVVVPERRTTGAPVTFADQFKGLGLILRSPAFQAAAPLVMTTQAAWLSTQALWFGPWLRDMAGLDAGNAAEALFIGGLAMIAGYAFLGWLAERLSRFGIPVSFVAVPVTLVFIAVQALLALGSGLPAWVLTAAFSATGGAIIIFYADMTQRFPVAMAGRVNTTLALYAFSLGGVLQILFGLVLDLFPAAGGGYSPSGYLAAFGGWVLVQIACFIWYLARLRHN
ncbi:MAG: MFS transporter [Alphaproteobacteria bacterium]|nr:MFS transporter [Alphaproteobacteria bacterium]